MFVIVVRLDKIEDSAEQLWYWLRFIKNRMSEQPLADEKPTVILVGSSRDAVHDRTIAHEEKEGWVSDWGNDLLMEVCEKMALQYLDNLENKYSGVAFFPQKVCESDFKNWFLIHERFFVMDCRISDGRDIDVLRSDLVGAHKRLCGMAKEVPSVCANLLRFLPHLRSRHRDEPIIAVAELLRSLDIADIDPLTLLPFCSSICK